MEIFENGDLSYSCGRAKRRFSNTMTSYLRSSPSRACSIGYSACSIERASVVPGFSVFVWIGEYDFFENREKNFRFQKYPDTCGPGLNESDLG